MLRGQEIFVPPIRISQVIVTPAAYDIWAVCVCTVVACPLINIKLLCDFLPCLPENSSLICGRTCWELHLSFKHYVVPSKIPGSSGDSNKSDVIRCLFPVWSGIQRHPRLLPCGTATGWSCQVIVSIALHRTNHNSRQNSPWWMRNKKNLSEKSTNNNKNYNNINKNHNMLNFTPLLSKCFMVRLILRKLQVKGHLCRLRQGSYTFKVRHDSNMRLNWLTTKTLVKFKTRLKQPESYISTLMKDSNRRSSSLQLMGAVILTWLTKLIIQIKLWKPWPWF